MIIKHFTVEEFLNNDHVIDGLKFKHFKIKDKSNNLFKSIETARNGKTRANRVVPGRRHKNVEMDDVLECFYHQVKQKDEKQMTHPSQEERLQFIQSLSKPTSYGLASKMTEFLP